MSLINKDQAPRQRQLDEHDAHWHEEEERITRGKIAFACLLTMVLIALLAVYIPVEAATSWQSVSDSSLVDMFGEE
jgi:cell division septal protein FtsQ